MKISKEKSDTIFKYYKSLSDKGIYKETQILKKIMEKFNLKKTTAYDHSRGRDLGSIKYKAFEDHEPGGIRPAWEPVVKEISRPSIITKKKGTYIITGYDIRCGINNSFINCIKQLSNHLNASLLLVPINKNDIELIPKKLKNNFEIITNNIKFNNNLSLELVQTDCFIQNPVLGWRGAFQDKSIIIPALTKELVSEPSEVNYRQILTTGSVGYLDAKFDDLDMKEESHTKTRWYRASSVMNNRRAIVSQRFVKPSALVVTVMNDELFTTRYVTMEKEGIIYDLGYKITKNSVSESNPLALVVGDHHADEMDIKNHRATLDMIKTLNPKEVILNDFYNGTAFNHHIMNDINKYDKVLSIDEEVSITKKVLKSITDISNRVVYLQSNHDNFILKFLNGGIDNWRINGNLKMCYILQAYMAETNNHPIIKLLDLDKISNLYFSPEREIYKVGNTSVIHGHESFVKIGFRGLAKAYDKVVTGHFHKPEVFRNSACTGTMMKVDHNYHIGINVTSCANCLIQPDESLQLITITDGKWR